MKKFFLVFSVIMATFLWFACSDSGGSSETSEENQSVADSGTQETPVSSSSGEPSVTQETPEAQSSQPDEPGLQSFVAGDISVLKAVPDDSKVILTWDDPVYEGFSSIEISWEPDGSQIKTVAKNIKTYTADRLTNGTNYTFTVKAVYENGSKSQGITICSQPSAPKPNLLNVLALSIEPGPLQATLKWSAPNYSGFDHVEITWSPGGTVPKIVQKNIQSYTASGLANGGTFSFLVQTVDVYGNKSSGISVSVKLNYFKVHISASSDHALILTSSTSSQDLWAVGFNNYGQLGNGTTNDFTSPVYLMSSVNLVTAGPNYSLILKSNATLWSTGSNGYYQLGDGTNIDRTSPVQILTDVSSMAAGFTHILIRKRDGSLWGAGSNSNGQIGAGSITVCPTPVKIVDNVNRIAAGYLHSIILKTDGSVWTTGFNNSGQLGDGSTITRTSPIWIMNDVSQIDAGMYFNLMLKTDGTLWVVGDNRYGQLGDGTNSNKLTPVQIMDNVSKIAAGSFHCLILKKDGTLWGAGNNVYGQLGDGSTTDRAVPVQIMKGVNNIAAGGSQSYVFRSDGTIWAMGKNTKGELCDGTTINRVKPVKIIVPSSIGANISSIPGKTYLSGIVMAAGIIAGMILLGIFLYRRKRILRE